MDFKALFFWQAPPQGLYVPLSNDEIERGIEREERRERDRQERERGINYTVQLCEEIVINN